MPQGSNWSPLIKFVLINILCVNVNSAALTTHLPSKCIDMLFQVVYMAVI